MKLETSKDFRLRISVVSIVLVMMFCVVESHVFANEQFRSSLAGIAEAAKLVVKERKAASIVVGQFTGPPAYGSSAGPGMQKLLKEELGKRGVRTTDLGSEVAIQGRYFVRAAKQWERSQLVLEVTFVDRNGETLKDLDIKARGLSVQSGIVKTSIHGGDKDWDGSEILAEVLGATVDLGPPNKRVVDGPPDDDGDKVIDSFKSPTAHISSNNWVYASRNSEFGVCILSDGKRLPIKIVDGQPFVELKKGDEFQIGLFNGNRRYYASAITTVDGVNTFGFGGGVNAQGKPFERWILDPGKVHTIEG